MIIVVLGYATAHCNAQATDESYTQLPPVQSDLIPHLGTTYFISPPWIYKSTGDPGPTESGMNTAWSLGNEFVFRTLLRKYSTMPAAGVVPRSNGWFIVGFKRPDGKDGVMIEININSNIVMLTE